MPLEFSRLIQQVDTMGGYLSHRSQSTAEQVLLALQWLNEACDLEPIYARVERVRQSNISGYRGAAPLSEPHGEIVCGVGAPRPEPSPLIVIAADGSQVYPDTHGAAFYYLTNLGLFRYEVGTGAIPQQATLPELVYAEGRLVDKDGRSITNQTVNARRTLLEVQALAREAWELSTQMRDAGQWLPAVFLHDGNLLKVFGANEVADAAQIERDYLHALAQLRDADVLLAGYVDRPRGANLISMLHLLHLPDDGITEAALKTNGPLEGVTDEQLFRRWLGPGERSALLTLNSPQNREYKVQGGDDLEIAFFYVNVATPDDPGPEIARVDVPLWVARRPEWIDLLHGALLAQCAIQGRKRYPYAITRADELAYVNGQDRQQLDTLIRTAMRRHQLTPEQSNKLQTKGLARGQRRQHRLRA